APHPRARGATREGVRRRAGARRRSDRRGPRRGRRLHGCVDEHGAGAGVRTQAPGVPWLSGERRAAAACQARCDRDARSARPPWRRDHGRCDGWTAERGLRSGRESTARAEGGAVLADGGAVMAERVILADCCEDWIIEWGGYYKPGRAFRCPECATDWQKSGADEYRRGDGRVFQRRTRIGPQASFPYLASADGQQPQIERCCAKI